MMFTQNRIIIMAFNLDTLQQPLKLNNLKLQTLLQKFIRNPQTNFP